MGEIISARVGRGRGVKAWSFPVILVEGKVRSIEDRRRVRVAGDEDIVEDAVIKTEYREGMKEYLINKVFVHKTPFLPQLS